LLLPAEGCVVDAEDGRVGDAADVGSYEEGDGWVRVGDDWCLVAHDLDVELAEAGWAPRGACDALL